MRDLSTMGILRGTGLPLADSVGRPLGPARMGSVSIKGQNRPVQAPQHVPPAARPALSGPAADMEEARKKLDKASVTAQQIQEAFNGLADLIGEDAAATALEQAAASLESAAGQYQAARRTAPGAD